MKRPHEIRAEDFSIKIQPKVKGLDEIFPLIPLCASVKLYEVEEWIAEGKPIQCHPSEGLAIHRRAYRAKDFSRSFKCALERQILHPSQFLRK